jgi:hypothetical protein
MATTWEANRLEKFRRLVNLDKLPKPLSPGRGVVADWQEKMSLFAESGRWTIFFRNTWLDFGGGVGEWGMRRETEQCAVKIFVSSHGFGLAQRYFRRQAMSSTAPEYPYQVTVDDDVVTFFVASPGRDQKTRNDSLLRLYRNVVFHVRVYDAKIEVRAVADDLVNFARQHSDLISPHLPRIDRPEDVASGEVLVRIPTAPDPFDDFRDTPFEVETRAREGINFMGFREDGASFHRKSQGAGGWIRVQAVDRRTLLSRVERFNILKR